MRKVKLWIQQRFHLRNNDKSNDLHSDNVDVTLPFLPTRRTSSLSFDFTTQSSSCEFFQRLPIEIRLAIYAAAFGDRTIHIDLGLRDPHDPKIPDYRLGDHQYDSSASAKWEWWSGVCCRKPQIETYLYLDMCKRRSGLRDYNQPSSDFVGALGWLLSCRRAYSEAIGVLYGSNTIFIQSVILTQNLSRLLLPQNMAYITSFEFSWELLPRGTNITRNWPTYRDLMSTLTKSSFPCLQKLLVVVDGPESQTTSTAAYLLPSDRIAVEFEGQLSEFRLQLPRLYFDIIKKDMGDIPVEKGGSGVHGFQRFRRDICVGDFQDLRHDAETMLGYYIFTVDDIDRGT